MWHGYRAHQDSEHSTLTEIHHECLEHQSTMRNFRYKHSRIFPMRILFLSNFAQLILSGFLMSTILRIEIDSNSIILLFILRTLLNLWDRKSLCFSLEELSWEAQMIPNNKLLEIVGFILLVFFFFFFRKFILLVSDILYPLYNFSNGRHLITWWP